MKEQMTKGKQQPAVGKKTFRTWDDALRHADQLKKAGRISEREYNQIKLTALAGSGENITSFVRESRRQKREA